jgi:MFS family permease
MAASGGACGSIRERSLCPSASLRDLLRRPSFLGLWASQIVSNVGDWIFALAVATALSSRMGGSSLARTMGLVLAAQVGPAALFGMLLGGSIADRYARRTLMITADLVRTVAVASLLVTHGPSVLHLGLVAACLGVFGAVFQPSLLASVPNVVDDGEIVTANAVMTGTFHVAIMIGPALGAAMVAAFGPAPAFALNALSFAISAMLLAGVRLPQHRGARATEWAPIADLVEGASYMIRTRLARGILIVMTLVVLFAAMKSPVETVFVRDVLTDGSAARVAWVLGLLTTAWGAGMVAGSALAPAFSARWPRERSLALSIGIAGCCVVLASRALSVAPVLALWVLAGTANGFANVAYESLLQERTPDSIRGRVFATTEALQDGAYFLGALVMGLSAGADASRSFAAIGIGFIGVAVVAYTLIGGRAGSHAAEPKLAPLSPAAAA